MSFTIQCPNSHPPCYHGGAVEIPLVTQPQAPDIWVRFVMGVMREGIPVSVRDMQRMHNTFSIAQAARIIRRERINGKHHR
jgi:hypothetical protein